MYLAQKTIAIQVPKGCNKLVVSMVSSLTGKASLKTSKAVVKEGQCSWSETVMKATKLTISPDGSSYDPKIYKFIVSKGSTHSDIIGEAEMDVAVLATSNSEAHISLVLKNCMAGTVLHVLVQCITPIHGRRLSPPTRSHNPITQDKLIEVEPTSLQEHESTIEMGMPSERLVESGSCMQMKWTNQKKLGLREQSATHERSELKAYSHGDLEKGCNNVERLLNKVGKSEDQIKDFMDNPILHTTIRAELQSRIDGLEEVKRQLESRLLDEQKRKYQLFQKAIAHSEAIEEMDVKIGHLELGRVDLEKQLQKALEDSMYSRSHVQKLHEQLAEKEIESKCYPQRLGSIEVEKLIDRIGRYENQIKEYLERHHVSSTKKSEYDSKIQGLESLKVQLERQLAEETRKSIDLSNMLYLHANTAEDKDAKVAHLQNLKLELEKQLFEALEVGRLAGVQNDELKEQVIVLQAQLEKRLLKEGDSDKDCLDCLPSNLHKCTVPASELEARIHTAELEKAELQKQLMNALEVGERHKVHIRELREQLAEKKEEASENPEVEALLNRIDRSEEQIKQFLEHHLMPSSKRLVMESKIDELESLRTHLETQLVNERRTSQNKFDELQQHKNIYTISLSDEMIELRRHLQNVEKENEELKRQNQQPIALIMRVESRDELLHKQLQEAHEEGRLTKAQVHELQSQVTNKLSKIERMELQLVELESARIKLNEQLFHSHEDRRQRLSHIDVLQVKLAAFDQQIESKVDDLRKARDSLEGRLRELQIELDVDKLLDHETDEDEETLSRNSLESRLVMFEKENARSLRLTFALEKHVVSLSRQKDDLERRLECSQSMLASYSAELEELRSQPTQQISLVMNVKSRDEAIERQLLEAEEQGRLNKSEVKALHKLLSAHSKKIAEMESRANELEKTKIALEDQLAHSKEDKRRSLSHLDMLQIRIAACEKEIKSKVEQLQKARSGLESRLQEFQIDLEMEPPASDVLLHFANEDVDYNSSNLEEQLKVLERENGKFLHIITKLERQVVALSGDNTKLSKQVENLKIENEELRGQPPQRVDLVMHVASRDEVIEKKLQEAEHEGRLTKTQVQELDSQLKEKLHRIEEMESRVIELENTREKLEEQLSHSYEDRKQRLSHIDVLQGRIAKFDKEIDSKVDNLKKARASLVERLKDLQIDVALDDPLEDGNINHWQEIGEKRSISNNMEARLQSYEEENTRCMRIISTLEERIIVLSSQKMDLTTHLDRCQRELISCKNQIQDLHKQPSHTVALVMNVAAKDELLESKLLKAQEEHQLTSSQNFELQNQLFAQVESIKRMEDKIEELESMRSKLENQLIQSHEERRQSISHLDMLQIQLAAFDVEIESRVDGLQKARISLESKMQVLRDDVQSQDDANFQPMHHLAFAYDDIDNADGSIYNEDSNLSASNLKLQARMKAFERENTSFVAMHAKLETQLLSLVDERDMYKTENRRAKEELADLRDQIDTHLSAKMRLETIAQTLRQNKDNLESQLKEFEDGNAQLSQVVHELQQRLESLKEENAQYKLEIDSYKSINLTRRIDEELEKNISDIAADNLQLMQTIARLENELVQVSEECSNFKLQLGAMHNAHMPGASNERSIIDLESELEELKRSKDNMEHQLKKRIEGLLLALDEHDKKATEGSNTTSGQAKHKALHVVQEAIELRSEELICKEKMRQMQELVRQATVEAISIKAEFDAKVQDLEMECHASKEHGKNLEFKLQQALKELQELRVHEKCSGHGQGQSTAAELFQAQLDISRLAIEQLMETERRALEASLQSLQAEKSLLFDNNARKNLYEAAENYPSSSRFFGLESNAPSTKFDNDYDAYDDYERNALTVQDKRNLKGKEHLRGENIQHLQGNRYVVSSPRRSYLNSAKSTSGRDKYVQVWNRQLYSHPLSHEVILGPLRHHQECLYYLDELQYLWLKFRGLAES